MCTEGSSFLDVKNKGRKSKHNKLVVVDFFVYLFEMGVSICSPGKLKIHYVEPAGLKLLVILLPLPLTC